MPRPVTPSLLPPKSATQSSDPEGLSFATKASLLPWALSVEFAKCTGALKNPGDVDVAGAVGCGRVGFAVPGSIASNGSRSPGWD